MISKRTYRTEIPSSLESFKIPSVVTRRLSWSSPCHPQGATGVISNKNFYYWCRLVIILITVLMDGYCQVFLTPHLLLTSLTISSFLSSLFFLTFYLLSFLSYVFSPFSLTPILYLSPSPSSSFLFFLFFISFKLNSLYYSLTLFQFQCTWVPQYLSIWCESEEHREQSDCQSV